MDKSHESSIAKSLLKILGITIGAFAVVLGLVFGIIHFQEKQAEEKRIKAAYEDIQTEYNNGNYSGAITEIERFNKLYADENTKLNDKVTALSEQVEEKIFLEISAAKDDTGIETACRQYINYYPNGKHIAEANTILAETSERLAPQRIQQAKTLISSGDGDDILEANRLLEQVINDKNVSSQYINEASKLAKNIEKRVAYETAESVSMIWLLTDATEYNGKKVSLIEDVIVRSVDRERKMLYVCLADDENYVGYDSSFYMEIYYGNLENASKWGSISSGDHIKLTSVRGRFKIYANRKNEGYIDAEYLS